MDLAPLDTLLAGQNTRSVGIRDDALRSFQVLGDQTGSSIRQQRPRRADDSHDNLDHQERDERLERDEQRSNVAGQRIRDLP